MQSSSALGRRSAYIDGLRAHGVLTAPSVLRRKQHMQSRRLSATGVPSSAPYCRFVGRQMATGTGRSRTSEVLRRQRDYERGLRQSGVLPSPTSSAPSTPGRRSFSYSSPSSLLSSASSSPRRPSSSSPGSARRLSTGTARSDTGEVLRRHKAYGRQLRASGMLTPPARLRAPARSSSSPSSPPSSSLAPTPRGSNNMLTARSPAASMMSPREQHTPNDTVLRRQKAYMERIHGPSPHRIRRSPSCGSESSWRL